MRDGDRSVLVRMRAVSSETSAQVANHGVKSEDSDCHTSRRSARFKRPRLVAAIGRPKEIGRRGGVARPRMGKAGAANRRRVNFNRDVRDLNSEELLAIIAAHREARRDEPPERLTGNELSDF